MLVDTELSAEDRDLVLDLALRQSTRRQ